MNNQQINEYIVRRHDELPENRWCKAISEELKEMGVNLSRNAVRNRYDRYMEQFETKQEESQKPIEEQINDDLQESLKVVEERATDKKYKVALTTVRRLQDELEAALQIQSYSNSYKIDPSTRKPSESTAITIWSDWHIEERVDSDTVNGLNEFTLEIGRKRTEKLFRKCVDFVKMYQQDTTIKEMVVALLGDFISNDIHDENLETAQLLPIEAILFAQTQIISGIEYILENTDVRLTSPCHSGNHARTTKRVHVSTEAGHSLEYLMYHNLAQYFKGNPRVTFIIPRSYLSYMQVYNYTIRFHHGHDIKYGGGIGGLFIPTYKAISQWNKGRHADLDCFGHWHQTKDGGNFYCNGSLIGFNPYAISIKADYEPPRQNFFLVHKELGKTIQSPIHL